MQWRFVFTLIAILVLPSVSFAAASAPPEEGKYIAFNPTGALVIPEDLKRCYVYGTEQLWNEVRRTNETGSCEVIVLRPNTDTSVDRPLYIRFDKTLVIESLTPVAAARPLIITNDTGRNVVIKAPPNQGCAIILRRHNFVMMGFALEGALCNEAK